MTKDTPITKEQFLEQVIPYTKEKTKKAFLDGYDQGYYDASQNREHKYGAREFKND